MGQSDSICDIEGISVGHWTAEAAGTGCTVILCPVGAVAGVDVRGGAPGTRETDLLRPECTVERVHAILLSGGSAFGLAAADGVLRWLEERGHGYDVGIARVPIVPTAVIFDLPVGLASVRPDAAAGYEACEAASPKEPSQGNVGAGTGATVGKALGLSHACKGGLGTASIALENGLIVGAIVVVNSFGNIHDPATGAPIAGVCAFTGGGQFVGFSDCVEIMAQGLRPDFASSNTTLAVIATNGRLDKSGITKVAQMAHDGMARAIRPVHTGIDGDVVFGLSCGAVATNPDLVGVLAADVLARAIVKGVLAARPAYGLPCATDFA
jgi:L-aminopeptidase/D-esterase-like protein